mmetsp:Transcript_53434/g.153304  ORF Transcript_53434/g.153304 Transcript_53434/m.153304 type:complete len:577 (-) Transcript_53434:104-1834(-)
MAGKKKGESEGGFCIGCIRRCGGVTKKVWVACGRPSIHTFFLWSGLIFLVCGLSTVVGRDAAQQFFCTIRPQSEYGGMGCGNTSSKLIGCSKPSCYRYALNITYMEEAKKASSALFEKFIDATTDVNCNNVLSQAAVTSPVAAITQMKKVAGTALAVTQSCIDYHCGVLLNTLNNSDLVSSTGVCTDKYGMKDSTESKKCQCGPLLISDVFTVGELAVPTAAGTSTAMQAIHSLCGAAMISKMYAMCSWAGVYPIWCRGTTVTTTTGTVTNTTTTTRTVTKTITKTATVRRLENQEDWDLVAEVAEAGEPDAGVEDGQPAPGQEEFLRPAQAAGAGAAQAPGRSLQTDPTATATAAAAPSPAGLTNSDLQDYSVKDWSPCTCYQQCTPGVKTRVVECLTDLCKAPQPASREACICDHAAECQIDDRLIALLVIFFIQAFIALIIFLCYFRTLSHTEDDFIIMGFRKRIGGFFYKQLPPFMRIMVLAQLFQVVWLVLDVWIIGSAADPAGGYQSDCIASKDLRLVSIITSILWVVQVALGKCTKTYARKPDWLYAPERSSNAFPLKQLRMMFRCLGP